MQRAIPVLSIFLLFCLAAFCRFGESIAIRSVSYDRLENKAASDDIIEHIHFRQIVGTLRTALNHAGTARLFVHFPEWPVPKNGPKTLPYQDDVKSINSTHVTYKAKLASIYVSSGSGTSLDMDKIPNCGINAAEQIPYLAQRSSSVSNDSQLLYQLVAVFNFVDSGYWGHAMENLWPRLVPLLIATVNSQYRITIVIPKRSILSSHTAQLAYSLNVKIEREIPLTAHRIVWLCDLPSYHFLLRSMFAAFAKRTLLARNIPSNCSTYTFLSRSHGASNGRNTNELIQFESELQSNGKAVVIDNLQQQSLPKIANRIHASCTLCGGSGSAMFHMTWLARGMSVAVVFPDGYSSQYGYLWLHAHSLGLKYRHILNSKVSGELKRLASSRPNAAT